MTGVQTCALPIYPAIDLDRVFLHLLPRRVYKDSSFTLHGTLFEAPPILAGKRVDVYFDPHPPITRVFLSYAHKDYGQATVVDSYANAKVKRSYSGSGELEPEGSHVVCDTPITIRANALEED